MDTDLGPGTVGDLRLGVMRLARRLRHERAGGLDDLGVASRSALGVLFHGGEMSIGALAASERVRPPSMTRTVACLVEAGVASRRKDQGDGRAVLVTLTEEGRRLVSADRRRRDAWLADRLEALTPDERAALRAATPVIEKLARS